MNYKTYYQDFIEATINISDYIKDNFDFSENARLLVNLENITTRARIAFGSDDQFGLELLVDDYYELFEEIDALLGDFDKIAGDIAEDDPLYKFFQFRLYVCEEF